ncbi:MAG: enoyl-CoA hydratase-related protein [Terracidiphilus sp.]
MSHTTLLVDEHGPVRTITLDRPECRNAMNPAMQEELIVALEEAAARTSVRVLVLAGAGGAFCSGLDLAVLRGMREQTENERRADAERIAKLFQTLYEMPIPTIAAVRGAAIAGGAGLATICDFTLATPEARFGFTEARIGFVPALVSAYLTPQIGEKRSRDLLLTARVVDAAEAHGLGLVNEVVPAEELNAHVQALAEKLMANSPQSLRATKMLMVDQNRAWLEQATALAMEANAKAREVEDFVEGISAFLEKRKPMWKA